MTGICGWFGTCDGDPDAIIAGMQRRIGWSGPPADCRLTGSDFGIAAVGPAETIGMFDDGRLRIVFHGHGQWRDDASSLSPRALCERLAESYRTRGTNALTLLGGDFSLAVIDHEAQRALVAIDRMGVRSLAFRYERGVFAFAANLDALAVHPSVAHEIDRQALYNYVYFHMVPGPGTIFQRSRRLLPGHYALADSREVVTRPYWEMRFEENRRANAHLLEAEFRSLLCKGVDAFALSDVSGAFLSGGTDSSTVTGMLANRGGTPARTYSIGFDATGYDEMEYARIAARRFRTVHHEYYVSPTDVVEAVPVVAAEYDQPFGNASAVPTYYCAKLAKADGVARMLAGDGGDELFGGNSRYAKQYQLALYDHIPRALRKGLLEPVLGLSFVPSIPLLRKARSYVEQARLPMPARYESYNLLERLGPENVFAPEFLESVDRTHPLQLLSEAYASARTGSQLNRILALDLRFTLADNDLRKVTQMCDRAGIDVAFPLLDDRIVAFSALLNPRLKLRGTRLRYFFKRALRDFLPGEILAKQKHGFGLPVGPWLSSHAPLRTLASDALSSLGNRGLFNRPFLDNLVTGQLPTHPGYYGTMVWVLMMLELWFQQHVDPKNVSSS